MAQSTPTGVIDLDALVVGGGFGGCHMLHLLRKQGLKVKLVDALEYFGGVWQANWYPGARVDCEMPYYLLSAPELMENWTWTERFPGAKELRAYFKHVDEVWKLSKDATFNTRVIEAKYDDANKKWYVKTHDGKLYSCQWFLPCTGSSNKQHWPEWSGTKEFKGEIYHPAGWPHDKPDILKDKRVAVIGAGSSAIQIVQEAAKEAKQLTQFIKTPNLTIAMQQRKYSKHEVDEMRPRIPEMMDKVRKTRQGLPYDRGPETKTADATPEEREELWEKNWKEGGFKFNGGSYGDLVLDEEANRLAYEFWLKKARPRIKDPQKRDILAPLKAPYYFSSKRPSMEQDYFEMVSQDNVDITNSPIKAFDSTGIITEDGKHREFDVIVVSTGYDAVIGTLKEMNIIGRGSKTISDHWEEGIYTYLGLTAHGFPNMFFVYGPQAPTSFTAGPPFIEQQDEIVVEIISKARDNGWETVEATAESEQQWRNLVLMIAEQTLLVKTDSWYMGSNVPGKKREMMLFMGGMVMYFEKCREAVKTMDGFHCIPHGR